MNATSLNPPTKPLSFHLIETRSQSHNTISTEKTNSTQLLQHQLPQNSHTQNSFHPSNSTQKQTQNLPYTGKFSHHPAPRNISTHSKIPQTSRQPTNHPSPRIRA
ncbi:hypothetical protein KC19_3G069700 [Ceratodon purpureus]|uniref:Uncharacterized protein n=1 Tax=Ceratodon purpureus TaxID=3225 RepID=A0A8T0IGV2_CERPU|nr:hypothetical protein KC19_3G069700 [Ceratodon purpureus]